MTKFKHIKAPAFVLDESELGSNLELIRSVKEKAGIEIILALKGFSMWSVFSIFKKFGFNTAAASSLNEARLTFEEFGSLAHTYAPAYSKESFDEIINYSSHIIFNSLTQYDRFYPLVKKSNKKISCGIRVNPEYSVVKTDLYNPCAIGSRLGVTKEKLKIGIPEGIRGIHFHNLCESSADDLSKTLLQIETLYGDILPKLDWVNMGGGHLMTRKGYNLNHLINVLKIFKEKYKVKVILEPSSAFVWDCGVLLANVLDIVDNDGIKTLMLDISFTAHISDTLEMPYRPTLLGTSENITKDLFNYRLGGASCLAGDYLEEYKFDKPILIGDVLVFNDMIHYTMVKTTMFNGVNHPNIGILKENGIFVLLKTFAYADFKNRLS